MADPLEDNLGRLNKVIGNLHDNLKKMLEENVGPATKLGPSKSEAALNKVVDLLEKLNDKFDDELKDNEKLINAVKDENKKKDKERKLTGKSRSIGTAPIGGGRGGRGGGGGGGGGGGRTGPFFPDDDSARIAGRRANIAFYNGFEKESKRQFGFWLAGISEMIIGGIDPMSALFQGVVEDATMFRREMRKVAFETQGITGDMREMQASFIELGSSVAQTGVETGKMQQAWLRNLKKGVKSQKEGLSITKSGLHLGTMIGANAEATADMFHDWHVQMGLNSNQMSQVGRNVQDVARLTGVTGDNLLNSVKTSEQFVKNMANAGTITADATKQIMIMVAEAQKLGIADQMSRVLDAATSTNKLLFESDSKTQSLLYGLAGMQGKVKELQEGTLFNSRSGMASMADGMEKMLERMSGGLLRSFDDIDKLTAEQRTKLNISLKNAFGIEIEEFNKMFKTMKVGSMSLAEQFADLDKEMKNTNLTSDERLKLEKKRADAIMNTGFNFLTKFDEQAKKAGISFADAAEQAVAKMSPDEWADLNTVAQELGMQMNNATDAWKVSSMAAAKQLAQAGGKDFTSALSDAMSSGDIKATREILGEMNKEQQKIGISQKKGVDPLEQMAQTLNEINENIRNMGSGIIGKLIDLIGSSGLLLIEFGMVTSSLWNIFGGTGGMMGKILGKFMGTPGGGGDGGILGKLFGKKGGGAGGGFTESAPSLVEGANNAASSAAGASKSLQIPKFDTGKMMSSGANLAKAAVALAALVAGMMVLAVVIMKLGQGLMWATGLDSAKAIEIGKTVAAVIGAAAIISTMSVGAAYGLKAVSGLTSMVPSIYKGALVMLAITPAMMLLAGAILGMGAILGLFVDSKQAEEISNTLGAVFKAAGMISLVTLVTAGALALLGMAAPFIVGFLPVIGAGALALLAMVPAVLLLAGAIVWMGKVFTSLVDSKMAVEVSDNLSNIFTAIGGIGWALMKNIPAIIGLPIAASLAIVPLTLGAIMLLAITGPTAALALALTVMNEALNMVYSPSTSEQLNTTLTSIFSSAWTLSKSLLIAVPMLMLVAKMAPMLPLILTGMYLGIGVFTALATPLVALGASIYLIGKSLAAMVSTDDAEDIAEKIGQIGLVLGSLGEVIKPLNETILPFTTGGWFTSSPAEKLSKSMPVFSDFFNGLTSFVRFGIIDPINNNFPEIDELQAAKDKLLLLADIFRDFPQVLAAIQKNMPKPTLFAKVANGLAKLGFLGITSPENAVNSGGKKNGDLADRICACINSKNNTTKSTAMAVDAVNKAFNRTTDFSTGLTNFSRKTNGAVVKDNFGIPQTGFNDPRTIEELSKDDPRMVRNRAIVGAVNGAVQTKGTFPDIVDNLTRDRASADAGSPSFKSDELSRIDEVTQKQLDTLSDIRDDIRELINIWKPKGSAGSSGLPPAPTRDPRRPMNAAQYGELKYGKPGGNANRNIINDGE